MELHAKQLQICMTRAAAAQFAIPKNAGLFNWRTLVLQRNKRNHWIVAL